MKKVCFWAFLATLAGALVYMVYGIVSILNAPFTSFPWYAASFFTALYFGPVLVVEAALLLWLHLRENKRKN